MLGWNKLFFSAIISGAVVAMRPFCAHFSFISHKFTKLCCMTIHLQRNRFLFACCGGVFQWKQKNPFLCAGDLCSSKLTKNYFKKTCPVSQSVLISAGFSLFGFDPTPSLQKDARWLWLFHFKRKKSFLMTDGDSKRHFNLCWSLDTLSKDKRVAKVRFTFKMPFDQENRE